MNATINPRCFGAKIFLNMTENKAKIIITIPK
jgi:hypothetical protein